MPVSKSWRVSEELLHKLSRRTPRLGRACSRRWNAATRSPSVGPQLAESIPYMTDTLTNKNTVHSDVNVDEQPGTSETTTGTRTAAANVAVRLADLIARDGVDAHTDQLDELARTADRAGVFPGSVSVLLDDEAAATQKARAFIVLHRNWQRVLAATAEKAEFDAAFEALSDQWGRPQGVCSTGDIETLWESRVALDARRVGFRR